MKTETHDPTILTICILAVGFLFLLFVGFLLFLASRVPIFPVCKADRQVFPGARRSNSPSSRASQLCPAPAGSGYAAICVFSQSR